MTEPLSRVVIDTNTLLRGVLSETSVAIELAIELRATHIVSADKDLLSLPRGRGDAARRFRSRLPGVEVLDAEGFLRRHSQ